MMDKTAASQSKRASTLIGPRSPDGETGSSSRRLSSYLQSVAQISGVVTIIAATVYALGEFTLVLPISNTYDSTFPAAWYAASVVPKTVVVGHGIRSLAWPSLALTVATTLFALMVLWVLYVVSIGWRHARQTASQLTLYLTSLAVIYSLLALLIVFGFQALWPAWVQGSALELPDPGVAYYAQRSLTFMQVPVDILIVLLCSVTAIFVVARGMRYMWGMITSRAFPSVSLGGLLVKGLVLAWLTLSVLFSVSRLQSYFTNTTFLDAVAKYDNVTIGYIALPFLLLALLWAFFVMLLLLLKILKGLRYLSNLNKEENRNQALPSASAALAGLGGSAGQRIRAVAPTLLYSVVLFLVFYLASLVAMNVLYSFVLPLIDNTSEGIKSESWLDECFVPLVVGGALITLGFMYRKGWRGLGRGEYDLFSQVGWLSFSKDLLRGIGSRSIRSGLLWSLGLAYVVALASAFLLAALNPPPLPTVEVNELPALESDQTGRKPDFVGEKLALLAHADGYWYLLDKKEHNLLVIPDRTDKFIKLRLDKQP